MPALVAHPTLERARLEALRRYHIVDTPPEEAFDRVAKLAGVLLGAPLGFISFIQGDRQWFKACFGAELAEAPRETSFCTHTIEANDVFCVPDTLLDARFRDVPFVAGEPGVRFYAGAPLTTPDGINIGTVFVVDLAPRSALTPAQCEGLKLLAASVMDTLEARRSALLAEDNEQHLKRIISSSSDLIYTKDLQGRYTYFNRPPFGEAGPQVEDIVGKTDWELFPDSAEAFTAFDQHVLRTQRAQTKEETLDVDGKTNFNFSSKSPYYTPDGELAGVLGISRDVTEEVNMREELKHSFSLLQATFDAATDGILNVDLEGKVLSYNRRYQDIRRLPLVQGEYLSEHAAEQHVDPAAFRAHMRAVRDNPGKTFEKVWELKDGRFLQTSSAPQRLNGEVVGRVLTLKDITEVRRTQLALFESEAKLRAIIEASSDSIFTKDLRGRYTFINEAGARNLGYSPDEVLGKTDADLFTAEDANTVTGLDQEIVTLQRRARKTLRLNLQGEEKTIAVEKVPLFDQDNKLTGVIGISRDMTEEVRMREELERSLSLLQATFDATSEGILSVGLDRKIQAYNQHYLEMRDVPDGVLASKDDLELIAYVKEQTVDPERMNELTEAAYAQPELPSKDVIELKNGRLLERSSFPTRLDGQVIGRVWSFRDISEETRIKAELEHSLSLLKTTFDAIDKGVLNVGLDGELRSFNQTYVDMWAVPDAVIAKRDDAALIAHARSMYRDPAHLDSLSDLLSNPEATRTDVAELKDGRLVERTLTPQYLNGDVIGRVWTFRDVTDELRTREAMRLAKEEAEAANRAKSEFLSRMSHELRTPLNAILGFGQLLQLGDLSDEDGDAVSDIVRAGRHLLKLIDEVLDIAQIESGRVALSVEPVPLWTLLDESVEMVAPLADGKRVELYLEAVPPDVHVLADQQRLKQVLLNLLSNAIKYNKEFGEVRLSHSVVGDRIRIRVCDSGIGIAPELLPRVFDPFDRLGAEASEVEGTGIGLALTRHLVELMNGTIRVESTPGEGSSFTLEFSTAQSPNSSVVPETPTLIKAEHDYTVVYVEDNLSNLKLVERIFADMGKLKLLTAVQGRIGLELAMQHVPDLILLDLNLPDVSGAEVLKALRSHPMTEHTPVVVVSADAMPERVRQLSALGAEAYLTKPLDIGHFTQTIQTLLERS